MKIDFESLIIYLSSAPKPLCLENGQNNNTCIVETGNAWQNSSSASSNMNDFPVRSARTVRIHKAIKLTCLLSFRQYSLCCYCRLWECWSQAVCWRCAERQIYTPPSLSQLLNQCLDIGVTAILRVAFWNLILSTDIYLTHKSKQRPTLGFGCAAINIVLTSSSQFYTYCLSSKIYSVLQEHKYFDKTLHTFSALPQSRIPAWTLKVSCFSRISLSDGNRSPVFFFFLLSYVLLLLLQGLWHKGIVFHIIIWNCTHQKNRKKNTFLTLSALDR